MWAMARAPIATNLLAICFTLVLATFAIAASPNTNVLVVRGGHAYDTPEFEDMCLELKGVQCDLVLTSHMQRMKAEEIASKYGAILFLNQNKFYPTSPKNRQQYMDLAKRGVGMVFLQFTLSSQPEWDEYHDLVGGKWFLKNYEPNKARHSTYFTDLTLDIEVLDRGHPVTEGLDDFTMTDAYYGNIYIAEGVHPLLGTRHPDISKTIAWTHRYDQSKVVYVMPGFTKGAYQHPSYRRLLENALQYVANREGVE